MLTGLISAAAVEQGYNTILANARAYKADARILGVQVQQMLPAAQEVIVGATTDPSFGKLVAFGLGNPGGSDAGYHVPSGAGDPSGSSVDA